MALGGVGIFAASALFALAPALACVCIAWVLDRNEREPIRLLGITFLWGAFPAIGISLLINAEFVGIDIFGEVAGLVLVAPVIEE